MKNTDKFGMEKSILITIIYASFNFSTFAGGEEELLEQSPELKNLVCLTTAASPVHRAPASYGCPGQGGGGAKFEKSPASEPPGIRAIKNLYRKLRYELFGPVVVNRSSFSSPDCQGHGDGSPLNFEYKPGDYDKCIAALYFDFKETKKGHVPMTTIYQCHRTLCNKGIVSGIEQFIEQEKLSLGTPVEQYLNCPNAAYDI